MKCLKFPKFVRKKNFEELVFEFTRLHNKYKKLEHSLLKKRVIDNKDFEPYIISCTNPLWMYIINYIY